MSEQKKVQPSLEQRHAAARDTLKAKYSVLDDAWKAAEKELAKYHLPDAVWHKCYTRGTEPYEELVYLVVYRARKEVYIDVSSVPEYEPEDAVRWRISSAPVKYRVELVKYLPALREAVVKSAEDFMPKVDSAIHTLNSFTTA